MVYRLSSFDEVVKAYEGITPLRGARANEDIRPLAQRRYWWNRVQKISDTKYLLLDGHWGFGQATAEMREITCPIVWERKEDGDYITIRSHMNSGISVSRYTFLQNHLPKDMFFHYDNGKHYVKHHATGIDHYLPKFKGKMDWQAQTFEMHQDNKIVFKHDGKDFTRANELQPFKTRRIDKEADKELAPKVTELYEWMQVVLPILGTTLHDVRGDYANKLTDNEGYGGYWYWTKYVKPSEVRAILSDPEHEKRMALAVCLANEANALDDEYRFEVRHNTFTEIRKVIRKVADLYLTEAR
jgi:hypothetical protein